MVFFLFVLSITLTIEKVILRANGVSFHSAKKELKLVSYFYYNSKFVQCHCQLVS